MAQAQINHDFGSRLRRLEYWAIAMTVITGGYWMDERFSIARAIAYFLGVGA